MGETDYYSDEGRSFEWDIHKAESNLKKHGISFVEAASCWRDPYRIKQEDEPHSWEEQRIRLLGFSRKANLLLVCHAYREERGMIRLISARKATKQEEASYESGSFQKH